MRDRNQDKDWYGQERLQSKEGVVKKKFKDIKKRNIKAIIWSVALYAAETWTYKKEDIRRLETFEMWVLRRMEKINWRDMKTNEEVLQISRRKKKPYGCDVEKEEKLDRPILRGESLLKEVIEGRMIGKIPGGRKRLGTLNKL